jgi:predicted TIM-barrel enzyme
MAKAGADIVVAHMGTTTSGSTGARTVYSFDECVTHIDAMVDAAKSAKPGVIALCHGGPIAEPEDAERIIGHCKAVDGFYGASSMERLPTERAIKEQTERFLRITRSR